MLVRLIAVLLGTLCVGACSGKNGSGSGGVGGSNACADKAEAVRALYAAEAASEEDPTLAADLLEANVHMVLKDCAKDPGTFEPCIDSAKTVQELEAKCVIPVDDEGRTEEREFR